MPFTAPDSQPGDPLLINTSTGRVPASLVQKESPYLETRPGVPRLINSASGSVNVPYTTDIFSTNPPPDLFSRVPTQAGRIRAYCTIMVDGFDVTDKMSPHLLSVRIVESRHPEATIELDDRDGRLPIPPPGGGHTVTVKLGWMAGSGSELMFNGYIWDVEYSFSRGGGGRRMTVTARGIDITSKQKEPGSDNMGDGAPPGKETGEPHGMGDFLQQIGKNAGINVNVSGFANKFKRDHWEMNNESPMQLITRLAKEHGMTTMHYAGADGKENVDVTAFGESKSPTIVAQAGYNLISLRLRPYSARGQWSGSSQHWFDTLAGQWKRGQSSIAGMAGLGGLTGAVSKWLLPHPAADQMSAQSDSDGGGAQAGYGDGHGRICINGEPTAHYRCHVQVVNVRPGVDGDYVAFDAVEHIYSRQGYVTWLDVKTNATAGSGMNVMEGYFGNAIQAMQLPGVTAGLPLTSTPQPTLPGLPTGIPLPTSIVPTGTSTLPLEAGVSGPAALSPFPTTSDQTSTVAVPSGP